MERRGLYGNANMFGSDHGIKVFDMRKLIVRVEQQQS